MKYIYEFIGTFILVFTVGMTIITPGAGMMAAFAIGLSLAVMIYAGASVSGAHYNPAVSLALYARRKLPTKELLLYWLFQFLGAASAAFVVLALKGASSETVLFIDPAKALFAEFLFTFALCFVVLHTTSSKAAGNSYYGFAIGGVVMVGAYAVGAISGAAFNPAVALASTLMNMTALADLWVFLVANFLGALVASALFTVTNKKSSS